MSEQKWDEEKRNADAEAAQARQENAKLKDMSEEKSEQELTELLAHDLAGVEDYVEMREIPYWIQVLAEKIIEKGWRKHE